MIFLLAVFALISGTALLVYRKRRSEKFFDPHHEQAFEVLVQSFPGVAEGGRREETAHA